MYVKKKLKIDGLGDLLVGIAFKKWINATDEQRQAVWDRLEEVFYNEVPSEATIDDFIRFECDDIFFPEENNESLKRNKAKQNKLESRIKRLEKLLSKRK